MSTIILPDRWRHQPKGSSDVDWGNSLCRDLTAVVNPAAPRTLITNELITPIGTGSIQPRQYGKAIVCLAGSYGASVAADADSVIGTANNGNEFTLALVARFTDTTARASSLFGFVGTNRVQAHAPYSDGTIYWDFGGTGNRRTTSSGFTKSTNLATFVFQYGVLSPYRAIWYNGQSLASSTTIDTAPRGATTDPFYLGGAVGQAGDNVEIYFAAFARRVWSAGEITEFHANPWQLLKKKPRILYFPSAGGGASISGALESISLATFGATVASARDIAAALESVALTTSTARVSSDRAVTAAVESITISTSAATVSSDRAIAGAVEAVALATNPATVALGVNVGAATESVTLTANAATVALDASVAATLEAITVTGLSATVQAGSDNNISAQLESITVTVNPATVARDSALAAALESITVTPLAASVAVGSIIGAALEALTLTSYPAGIALDVAIAGGLEQINLTTLAAQVGLGSNVAALVEAITLTEFGATLTMTGEIAAALESIGLTTFVATVVGGESALTTPGLEFTIPVGRMHYAIPIGRIHFTIPRD